jgi:hypothetical protein
LDASSKLKLPRLRFGKELPSPLTRSDKPALSEAEITEVIGIEPISLVLETRILTIELHLEKNGNCFRLLMTTTKELFYFLILRVIL